MKVETYKVPLKISIDHVLFNLQPSNTCHRLVAALVPSSLTSHFVYFLRENARRLSPSRTIVSWRLYVDVARRPVFRLLSVTKNKRKCRWIKSKSFFCFNFLSQTISTYPNLLTLSL